MGAVTYPEYTGLYYETKVPGEYIPPRELVDPSTGKITIIPGYRLPDTWQGHGEEFSWGIQEEIALPLVANGGEHQFVAFYGTYTNNYRNGEQVEVTDKILFVIPRGCRMMVPSAVAATIREEYETASVTSCGPLDWPFAGALTGTTDGDAAIAAGGEPAFNAATPQKLVAFCLPSMETETTVHAEVNGVDAAVPRGLMSYIPTAAAAVVWEREAERILSEKAQKAAHLEGHPDWDENDEMAPAYIANRPFYTDGETVVTMPEKYLPESLSGDIQDAKDAAEDAVEAAAAAEAAAEIAQSHGYEIRVTNHALVMTATEEE